MRTLIILALLGTVGGGAFYYTKFLRAEQAPNFRMGKVDRGDLLITISATGTLEPEGIVDVGAQVMGRVQEFGLDSRAATDPEYKDKTVDYNSVVKTGDLLALIDPTLYKATLDQAIAGLNRAEADLLQMKARLAQTEAEYERAERLREINLSAVSGIVQRNAQMPSPTTVRGISDADYILAKANFEVAKANVAVGESAVLQQQAMVDSAQTNYDFCKIFSPVDGTIIARRVDIGQTVVANLNAPSLFLIAKDLRRMEIWTAVNEADIGKIKVGMPVQFEVDAFDGDVFRGTVKLIRLDAELQNHVVVYRVIVSTPNDDLKLLPYLSAHVKFEVDRRDDVLLVPNAALRYTPRPELVTTAPAIVHEDDEADYDAADPDSSDRLRRVWVRSGNKVYPVDVLIGLTDGTHTEIVAGELEPGMQLVLGEELHEVIAETNNPLAPPRFRGKKKS